MLTEDKRQYSYNFPVINPVEKAENERELVEPAL